MLTKHLNTARTRTETKRKPIALNFLSPIFLLVLPKIYTSASFHDDQK